MIKCAGKLLGKRERENLYDFTVQRDEVLWAKSAQKLKRPKHKLMWFDSGERALETTTTSWEESQATLQAWRKKITILDSKPNLCIIESNLSK